jgi:hypothetical protein
MKGSDMSDSRQGDARPKFPLGRIYATPGALELLERSNQTAHTFLARHVRGDWGLVHPDDAAANERALRNGTRIVSSYVVGATGVEGAAGVIWVITEADRCATTLLLPGEY